MNMKHGTSNDGQGNNIPVRMYESFRQTHGKQGITVYRVEFLDKNRWEEWLTTPDKDIAEKAFNDLTS